MKVAVDVLVEYSDLIEAATGIDALPGAERFIDVVDGHAASTKQHAMQVVAHCITQLAARLSREREMWRLVMVALQPALDQLGLGDGTADPTDLVGAVEGLVKERDRLRSDLQAAWDAAVQILAESKSEALISVLVERVRQDRKWGEQNHDPFTYLSVLVEEVGEFAQAALHSRYGGHAAQGLREEAVHAAAVALAIVECIDRGKWMWAMTPEEVRALRNRES